MGRKHEIVEEDPILKKNHRIQKRRKARQEERQAQLEQQAKDRKKLQQLSRIKQIVIEEQNRLAESVVVQQQSKEKQSGLFSRLTKTQKPLQKMYNLQNKLKQLAVVEGIIEPQAAYNSHFGDLNENIILKVHKQEQTDSTQIVKQQLRQLFGKEPTSVKKTAVESDDMYEYHLKPELKRLQNVTINGAEYSINQIFEKTVATLPFETNILRTMLKSYKDYVFIENKEEERIGEFRQEFVEHVLKHLQLCGNSQKSKGFTNPKILILTPFMGDARAIIDLIAAKVNLPEENRERVDEIDDETDMFRISMTISQRNKKLKYFANFNHAHVIISSPLGLRTIVGAEGDQQRDYSFLSSVEVLLVERAHVIMMQNWSHLLQIVAALNKMPKYESMVNPIQSIRDSFLNQKGKFYRQNIVFSEYGFPQLNALAKRHFQNHSGLLQDVHYYSGLQFQSKFHQEFLKIDLPSIDKDLDVRLDFFKRKLWNRILNDELLERYLIFTHSYFEFVKLKSFFEKVNAPAQFISEHTKKSKVQSRISRFNNKEFRFIVVTERAYFFEVCQIQKIENILFYSLPRNSWIYRRLVESLIHPKTQQIGPSNMNNITGLCSRYDIQAIQRIIGTVEAQQLLSPSNKASSMII